MTSSQRSVQAPRDCSRYAFSVAGYVMAPALASAHIEVGSAAVRTGGIAIAVGLDVLALSVGIGVLGVPWPIRLRVGAAFATAEIFMQCLGALIGALAGHAAGDIAAYAGFIVLAFIGVLIFRESFGHEPKLSEKITSGVGLLAASASISLDSLGVGFSLPTLQVPLLPLIATVAVTTVMFTLIGLAFGEMLGARFRKHAERAAGIILVLLAVIFTFQHYAH